MKRLTAFATSSRKIPGLAPTLLEGLESRRYLAAEISFAPAVVYNSDGLVPVAFTIAYFDSGTTPDLGVIFRRPDNVTLQSILLGNGAGSFQQSSSAYTAYPSRIAAGEWNDDGSTDLYVDTYDGKILSEAGDNNGGQNYSDDASAVRLSVPGLRNFTTAIMNNNGTSDVLTTASNGAVNTLNLYSISGRNYTPTVLEASTSTTFYTVNALNVSGSVYRDVITTTSDGESGYRVAVKPRTVSGGYGGLLYSGPLSGLPLKLRMADFNGDGKLDAAVLVTARGGSVIDLLMGKGDGTFEPKVSYGIAGSDFALGDFDTDGRVDVAYATPSSDPLTRHSYGILRNRGDGTLESIPALIIGQQTDMLDSADFNNDGKPDLIVRYADTKQLAVLLNLATPKNAIRGTVFNDINQNGLRDSREAAVADKIVFLDQNSNGILDRHETYTTTLRDGTYEFRVNDGFYPIRQYLTSRFEQTTPTGATGIVSAQFVTATGIHLYSGKDFGFYDRGTVSGVVFNDANANNVFDVFESGIGGVSVQPFSGGSDFPAVVTDSQGRYSFFFEQGIGSFHAAAPRGYLNTTEDATLAISDKTKTIVANLGITRPGNISGHVFYDYGVNARRDTEDTGVGGLTVFLDFDNDGVLDRNEPSMTTNNSRSPSLRGGYQFSGLFPKSYVVRLVKPRGYLQTRQNDFQNNQLTAAAGPGTGGPYTTFAIGGSNNAYTDFGVIRPIYVTGRAYVDTNADGRIGRGEVGLGAVQVFIDYNGNGVADAVEPYTTSDKNGNYTLASSRAGTFNVRATLSSGVNATRPSSHQSAVTFVDGAAVTTGVNFGLAIGAFSTAPYADPINIAGVRNPTALASGDFNGDRRQDVIVASNAGQSQVYLGNGHGAFTPGQIVVIGGSTRYMIAVDVSGDGKPDLVGANEDGAGGTVLINNGNGTFADAMEYNVTSNTYGVAAGYFDKNNTLDLAFVGISDHRVAILLNNGDGTYQPAYFIPDTFGGRSIVAGDVNGDQKTDLVVTHPDSNEISVLIGSGKGGFSRLPTNITTGLSRPTFLALSDLNNDGKLDIVAVNESSEDVRVKLGLGNGTFADGVSYSTASAPTQVAVLDIDSDGKLDLIVSCRSDGTTDISGGVSIIRGRGDGSFVDQQIRTAHTSPTAVAIADFNGDRRLDILSANFFSDDVSLLLNNTGT